ncbi:MAG TPA: hypothetical protein VE978_22900 [Chitinophagales bacterium]|nr:hypothetical protein [Chitinophagales bacterium]
MKRILFVLSLNLPFLCHTQIHYGKWRWSIRTFTEAGGQELINQQSVQATIDQILGMFHNKASSYGKSGEWRSVPGMILKTIRGVI